MRRDISDYAKIDPAFMTDGLFVPKANKSKAINIKREWDKGEIGFRGVQLGAMHQSVLLAVCARTGRDGLCIEGNSDDLLAKQLWLDLATKNDVKSESRSVVRVSAYSILVDSGIAKESKAGGSEYKKLLEALRDLTTLTVYRNVGNRGGASNLLSFDHDDDKLAVSLNWRLAGAIFGGQNIQVSLHERLHLKSPIAKILHAWLSANIRKGQSLAFGQGATLDTLAKHVWGDGKASRQTITNRRARLKEALEEIGGLDLWATTLEGRKALISRPKAIEGDALAMIRGELEDARSPGQLAEYKATRKYRV